MNVKDKHIAVLVHNYFEQAEFEEPIEVLKDAGAKVTVISANGKSLQGMQHISLGDTFTADLLLGEASSYDYDALLLPGGAINADQLRVIETAKQWVLDFLDSGKPLAAICHAPWLLVSADVLEGRHLTSYHTIRDDIINAGGDWINQAVVVDGNLITSRQPDDIPKFADELIKQLLKQTDSAIEITPPDTVLSEDDDDDLDDPDELQPTGVNSNEEKSDIY